jgi:hypothetical protein
MPMSRARRLGITPARRRGLHACFESVGYVARRSNATSAVLGHCYWQTADWLVAKDLAEKDRFECIRLTELGIEIAREEFAAR